MAVENYPYDFNVAQSIEQPTPTTIASAATITPTQRFTRLTGTTSVTKINPPVLAYHELVFVWTTGTANGFNTGGSGAGAIAVAYTTITDRPVVLYFDPRTKLYYPQTVV
jgi:hypothetical protein